MTAIERPLRHSSDQNVGMVSHQARRISEDVASLDSWTDALNLSASSDASFQFVSHDENRVDLDLSGSGFTGIRNDVNMDSSRYSVPRIERSVSLKSECDSPNYNVTDSCVPRQHSYGIHVNSNRPKHHHHHHHHSNHANQVDSWRTSGATAWFNNVPTSSSNYHHYRPHAFSSAGFRDIGQTSRFGIAADSRLGLPHTTIPNTRSSPHVLHSAGTHQNAAVSNRDFVDQSDNLVDQLDRESERIKTKFMSAWNNVKYGWTLKTKTNFKYDSPIFLLGKCYHRRAVEEDSDAAQSARISNIDEFRQDFSSRIWFTYRREFTALLGTKLTTDCGWGCMLRSGQMMLAQGLIMHFLGRDWRVYHEPKPEEKAYYKEIIRWFADQASDQSPFSIHKLVELGHKHGKVPGDWYGPASVSLILRDAVSRAPGSIPVLEDVCVYVAQDCTVYKQDIFELCQSRPKSNSQLSSSSDSEEKEPRYDGEWKRSVIILIPMRLGGECLNPIYIPCVKALLASDLCIGIIGGKPKHSLYFVGWQDDKLINLDPHYCQDVVDTSPQDFPVQSFHCVSPRKLAVSKMDPSCTVGFYVKSRADFQKFAHTASKLVIAPNQRGLYPLFIFSEGRSSSISDTPYREQGRLRIRHHRVDRDGNVRSPTLDSEDFVIL